MWLFSKDLFFPHTVLVFDCPVAFQKTAFIQSCFQCGSLWLDHFNLKLHCSSRECCWQLYTGESSQFVGSLQCVLLLNNSYTPNDSRSALLCLALFAAMYWRGSLNLRMNLEEMNVQKWKPLHCTLEKLQKLNYLMRVNSTYNNLALNKWWRSLLSSSNHQTIRKQSDAKTNLWAVLTMCQHKAKHWVSAIKWVLMRS